MYFIYIKDHVFINIYLCKLKGILIIRKILQFYDLILWFDFMVPLMISLKISILTTLLLRELTGSKLDPLLRGAEASGI